TWVDGASIALNKRILASNRRVNLVHRGFLACDRYAGGLDAIDQLQCPVLFLLGQVDQMTAPRAAQSLIDRARERGLSLQVRTVPVGHHEMAEAPDATLSVLKDFLRH
ncbi:MAG: TMEM53 family protein, partial [Comamonadaceae bacterium]|nr:TMEM53 family protein [Comamonadaceae bacterium]